MSSEGYARITLLESNVSRRIIYMSCLSTVSPFPPVTLDAGGQPVIHRGGAAAVNSAATLLARDATNGLYSVTLASSECSVMGGPGTMVVRFSNASTRETVVYVDITAVDSGDSMRYGLFALPNFAASAASGLLVLGTGTGGINASSGSVDAQYLDLSSKLTVGAGNIKAGTYSGVTVGINNIAAGAYSGVTIGGSSFVTINPGTYSSVTVSTGNIAPGTYSGVTVGVNNIASADYSSKVTVGVGSFNAGVITTATFAAAALDSTVFSTGAEQAFADRLLLRGIAGGTDSARSVGQALYAIRNKVDMSSSVGTVYRTDDTTSAFTVTVTAGFNPAATVDPKGL